MKVYKERHLGYGFSINNEYVFKIGPQKGKIYNGPWVSFRGRKFAGEKMSAELEKKWQIIRKSTPIDLDSTDAEANAERVLVYDGLKIKYSKRFKFPKSYTHVLTEKEIKKGEYERYFAQYKDELTEISKNDHKYYKKNSTAYHRGVKIAKLKLKLDIMAVDINQAAINEVANDGMPKILTRISAHDYMETQTFLYTAGGQLEYEDGVEYIGQYHIHPQSGPMEGPTHSHRKHAQLYWSEKQTYRPKDLV